MISINYALIFIIATVFNLYMMVLLARLLLQLGRANPFNPMTRFIITATKWPVGLCQRFLPTANNFDFAILFVVIMVALIKILLTTLIAYGIFPTNIIGLLIWSFGDITLQLANLLFYAIIIQVIASWVASGYSPILEVVSHITAPILKPCQRVIPAIGGLDITPIIAILILKTFEIMICWNIVNFGKALAMT